MRDEHCFFKQLSNGRCVAPCHYTKDMTFDGDCTGNTNTIMKGQDEIRVSAGFVDGTHKEIIHKDGTWRVVGIYSPDVNKNCSWGAKTS